MLTGLQTIATSMSLTIELDAFVHGTAQWQQDVLSKYEAITMAPLAEADVATLGKADSFARLQACARLTEAELAKICDKHDVDVWLAYVRRLPALIPAWEGDWIACATLAIIKYSKWSAQTTAGTTTSGAFSFTKIPHSPDVFEDSGRIAILARHLALLTNDCRWIGKGTSITHLGGGRYTRETPEDVLHAVRSYESRRPKSPPWFEIGIVPVPSTSSAKDFVFACLGDTRHIATVRMAGLSSPTAYLPLVAPANDLADILEPYRKAIEEKYGITLDAIMHFMIAVCRRVSGRMAAPTAGTHFIFDQNPDDTRFAGMFSVFLSLTQRGLFSMPAPILRDDLSAEICPPWSNDLTQARSHVSRFFDVFELTPARRGQIDVTLRLPFSPFLFTSPGAIATLDFYALAQFFRELVLGAREWAGKLHGDHFTMDVRRLAKRIAGVAALPKISGLKYDSGQSGEIDVPLQIGRRLYVVECKAYGKSAAMMAGDPKAINTRTQEIKSWVQQAQRAASTLLEQRLSVSPALPNEIDEIEWLVCTAGQEFICPVDKFGVLDDLPRICTVAELLAHLESTVSSVRY